MDSISLTTLAAVVGIMGFLYTYIKDRVDMGRAFDKLEQRVETLEQSHRVLEQLVNTLTETRIAVSRLEQKVDSISKHLEKGHS